MPPPVSSSAYVPLCLHPLETSRHAADEIRKLLPQSQIEERWGLENSKKWHGSDLILSSCDLNGPDLLPLTDHIGQTTNFRIR